MKQFFFSCLKDTCRWLRKIASKTWALLHSSLLSWRTKSLCLLPRPVFCCPAMTHYSRQHTKVVFHPLSLSWAKPLVQGYSVVPMNLALKLSATRQSSPEEETILSFNFLFHFFVAIKFSFLVFCLYPAAFQSVKQQTQDPLSSSLPVR